MKNEHKKNLDRRDFLKVLGGAAAVTSATLLPGCKNKQESAYTATTDIPTDQMTYRINPSTQDRVSLLGYGCMRWPTVSNNSARDSSDDIDQETVNKLVDVAITHGVNYFDTSPAYCKGRSERATGIALSRYPRDKYFIATKLSNFAPSTWSREASIAMYHNSFKELQVNYIDYLLLHGVGMGNGLQEFNARYIDNGVLDFLLAERQAGRIRNLGFSYHGDIKVFDYLLSRQYHGTVIRRPPVECTRSHSRQTETEETGIERGIMGIPFCRLFSRCIDRTERHDLHGAPARQSPHLLPVATVDGRGKPFLVRHRRLDDAVSDHPM